LSSAAWSVDSGATLRNGVQYLSLVLGVIGAVEHLDGDDFMDLLSWVCFLSALASLAFLVVAPASVIANDGYRGVFVQKNVLGEAMEVGALACLHGRRAQTSSRTRFIVMFSVISVAAVLSGSATSCIAILLYCVLGTGIHLLQKGGASRFLGVVGMGLFVAVLLVLCLNPGAFFEMIGKDSTLSGRTGIWDYVIPFIYQRPVLGYGYSAFFSPQNPAALAIANKMYWYVPEAHNGILEILLGVGLVGLSFCVYLWVRAFRLSLRAMRTRGRAMAITCISSCAGILLVGVSEAVLLGGGALSLVFFATAFFCEQSISRSRQRRPVFQRGVGGLAFARQTV